MSTFDYYTTPPQEIFDDIKAQAINIWNTYDDTYGYRTEKVTRVNAIENVRDNAWFIVAMFDGDNIRKLISMVRPETAEMIIDATKGQI